uniref:Gamma-glutamyl phosphate reductase n=1 Tax=Prevotella sp. GTC17260 TaxID=3236796 RepID=A0AB33JBB0_9BACT
MALEQTFRNVKKASRKLASMTDEQCNTLLEYVAVAISRHSNRLLEANKRDLERMDTSNPMYDRLLLTPERLQEIAASIRQVATLPSPTGHILKEQTLSNGLHLRRVSVPFGVIGVIYEARPNVTFDVFALCLKSGNACILKCGRDAYDSCQAAVALIHNVLQVAGTDTDIIQLLPASHEATAEMLNAVDYIDLCIPRGGKQLIEFVRNTARIPVIETGAGVVHCYIDKAADLSIGRSIICNAKTRRCSVCNSLDCLLIHENLLNDLPSLCEPLAQKQVKLHVDACAMLALQDYYPADLLIPAGNNDVWNTEWLSMQMGIRTVNSLNEAIEHIDTYGSGHSECIVTEDQAAAKQFQIMVDAACVYVNAPTSFTDGAQFGLGAEIGISTQKLGARGPMALEEMTTYKWLIDGHGQIRE